MRVFVTGANGFIGGAVASALIADGHKVRGLVRDKVRADTVAPQGIEPVVGSLDDAALLQAEARAADAVVNAASSDHRGAVEVLIAGLAGSGKPFLHTSGSSIVADLAMGEPSDRIFHEGTPIEPQAEKAARVAIDRLVLNAPGIRCVVLCNSMIYGNALGPPARSVQIPALVAQAKASGIARYIGRGLNRWSNVHIADVAALYALVLTRARSQPRVVRTESLRTNRHDTGSTTARSVDELALIRDTIRHYAPALIAPLSIQIRRAGVQKKFVGPHLGRSGIRAGPLLSIHGWNGRAADRV